MDRQSTVQGVCWSFKSIRPTLTAAGRRLLARICIAA